MKKITLALLMYSFLSTQSSFSMLAWFQEHKISLTVTATALTTGAYGYFGIIRPLQKRIETLEQTRPASKHKVKTLIEQNNILHRCLIDLNRRQNILQIYVKSEMEQIRHSDEENDWPEDELEPSPALPQIPLGEESPQNFEAYSASEFPNFSIDGSIERY